MKSKLFRLLKNTIVNSLKLKSTTKTKKVLMGILILYVVGTLVTTFGVFSNQLFSILSENNLTTYYIIMLFAFSSLLAFFFTIYSAKASLFENKDNELLLSLPLKRSTILLSRLIYLSFYNLIIGLIILLPGLFIYITNVEVTWMFYLSIFFMIVFFPLIPTILASLFGYLISSLTSKKRSKSLFELIYYAFFIFIYIFVMSNATKILSLLTNNSVLLNNLLKYLFSPLFLINEGLMNNNFIYIIYYVLINVILLLLFVLLLNRSYFKLISKLSQQKVKGNFKLKEIHAKTIKKTLIEKELKRYFSSAIYVFNTAFGPVLLLIFAFASLISKEKVLEFASTNIDIALTPFSLVLVLVLFIVSMSCTTNSSISIEKNNFWILKSLPIEVKDIFYSKKFLNKLIVLPATLICLIIFVIGGYITFIEMLLLFLVAYLFNFFVSSFGLLINIIFPKFDALNDNVIVKQSLSAFIGIFVPLIIAIVGFGLLSTNVTSNIDILRILIVFFGAIAIITNIILNNYGKKRFVKL